MRIENTDCFRNKMCEIVFKNNTAMIGRIYYIPCMSEKYDNHEVGWFCSEVGTKEDPKLNFKEIKEINVLY